MTEKKRQKNKRNAPISMRHQYNAVFVFSFASSAAALDGLPWEGSWSGTDLYGAVADRNDRGT